MPARSGRFALVCALFAMLLVREVGAETQVFRGTFSLQGFDDPAPAATAVGVATINSSGGGSHLATLELPGGLFSLHTSVPVTTPSGSPPLSAVEIDLTLGAGELAVGTAGTLRGTLPVPGTLRLCLLAGCGFFVDVPLTESSTRGAGIGGAPITAPIGSLGTLSIGGAPWQTGNAAIQTSGGSVSAAGFAHGPLSLTSSTAEPQGVLQAVTPVAVGFSVLGGSPVVVPVFGVLELKFLPEPSSLVSLAGGALLLAGLGARRLRRSARPR
jgi:hypothetical protein